MPAGHAPFLVDFLPEPSEPCVAACGYLNKFFSYHESFRGESALVSVKLVLQRWVVLKPQ